MLQNRSIPMAFAALQMGLGLFDVVQIFIPNY
jgi:hypothetical protein